MSITQYLIIPAMTAQAGQCRIVKRSHDVNHPDPLGHYRKFPEQWADAGLMSSLGKVICIDGSPDVLQEFKDCEPLMAGMSISLITNMAPNAPMSSA